MLSRLNIRIIRFFLVICVLTSAFFYSPAVEAATLQGQSYYDVVHASSDSSLTGYNFHTINANLNSVKFSDLTDFSISNDRYYSVDLETTVAISATQVVNWRIPYCAAGDYIVLLGSNVNTSQDFYFRQIKTFTMSGRELKESLNVSFRCYVFDADGLNVNFDGYVQIFLTDIVEVSSGTDDVYNAGYESGFRDGEDSGYNSGYGSGYQDGENAGFDAGYDSGFDDGAGSVDTESIYQDGYDAGYDAAYVEGFDQGYSRGYAEALSLNTSNSTNMQAGETQKYSFTHNYSNQGLDMDDFNTTYPSVVFNSDSETSDFTLEGFEFSDGEIYLDGNFGFEHEDHVYAYNRSSLFSVFETSSDVYAYRVVFKPTNVSLTKSYVYNLRLVFGSMSQVLNDNALIGSSFVNGVNNISSFWYVNDYSQQQLYISYLARFRFIYPYNSAGYDLKFSYDVDITPYTKSEFNAAAAAVEKQTFEMQQQMNDLKNGFDSSAGQSMNESFAASVNDYQTTEESLFSSAQSGLDSFTFVDFSSYPALVTSMSFVTSMMNAVYGAMGGETGPIGIVLSVLFSVMLVSMVIGLYRFYQDKKGGGD